MARNLAIKMKINIKIMMRINKCASKQKYKKNNMNNIYRDRDRTE